MDRAEFSLASPVWAVGRESEMNLWLSFRAIASGAEKTVLRLTGSSAYNVKVGGEFVAFGPARSAHGFFRVDELDISEYVKAPTVICINVAGYNADSFYHTDQPSFLCAELAEDGNVTAATGKNGFVARIMTEHEQKAQRYASQRTFCEIYNLTPDIEKWESDTDAEIFRFPLTLLRKTDEKVFIRRTCENNIYDRIPPEKIVSRLRFFNDKDLDGIKYPEYIVPRKGKLGACTKAFARGEESTDTFMDARRIKVCTIRECDTSADIAETVPAGEGVTYRFARNTTGKIELCAVCEEDTEILIRFDEILPESGVVDFRRMYTVNAVIFRMSKGSYRLATFEPYTMSAMQIFVTKGKAEISDVAIRYFGDVKTARFYNGEDAELQKIFDAAVETYRQNAFTIFTDCPSRERAGWLCDSFFTARAEKVLMGRSIIEKSFLENFFLPDGFSELPEGMFAECYPADHHGGGYIPNWAMWLVIELDEYLARTGDREFVGAAKPKIYALLDFLTGYENKDGLLEKLDRWVFVEWSKANKLTQDINYPSNMLYARMLVSMANLYGDEALREKAEAIHRAINEQALMPSGFYCDNSVYGEDGIARLSGECTEACQYYAFFCGTATPEKNPVIWERLLHDFGPERVVPGKWPEFTPEAKWKEIYPANAFIGNYLRLELLCEYGEHEKLKENIKGFFLKMADLTGTLWEAENTLSSCNHGFASHVVYWMDKLGMIS